MVGHGGSSAGSYLADPTSPIPSHCASIVVTSTVRVNFSLSKNYRKNVLTRTILSFDIPLVKSNRHLILKVLAVTIDAQWEGMGMQGQRGTSQHYFPHARP